MSSASTMLGALMPLGCPNTIGYALFQSAALPKSWERGFMDKPILLHMGVVYDEAVHQQIHIARRTAVCALMVLGGIVSGALWAMAVNALATTLSVGFRVTFLNAVIPSAQWVLPMQTAAVAGGVISGLHGFLCTPGTYRFFHNLV